MKIKIVVLTALLVFVLVGSVYAFELVDLEDDTPYNIGIDGGMLYNEESLLYYAGVTAGYDISDKYGIGGMVGNLTGLTSTDDQDKQKLVYLIKPVYYFKNTADSKVYSFGLVGSLVDEFSVGAGFGLEYSSYDTLVISRRVELGYSSDNSILFSGSFVFNF